MSPLSRQQPRRLPGMLGLWALLCWVGTADAQEIKAWDKVGGWAISVDASIGDGCFMDSTFENGTYVRFGVHPELDRDYLLLSHADWTSLKEDERLDLEFRFDRREMWQTEFKVIFLGDDPDPYLYTTMERRTGFIDEFANREVLRFFFDGNRFLTLGLYETRRAVAEIRKCQRAQQRNNNPFEGSSRSREPDRNPFGGGETQKRSDRNPFD